MNTIHICVIKSASLSKTIYTIRKTTGEPISLIKKHIENKEPVFICNYIDGEGIKRLMSLYEELISMNDTVEIFEHGRKTSIDLLKNLLKSYADTTEFYDKHPDW